MGRNKKYTEMPDIAEIIEAAYSVVKQAHNDIYVDDIIEKIASDLNLSENAREYTNKNGESILRYNTRWALSALGNFGAIEQPSERSGKWRITESFQSVESIDGKAVVSNYNKYLKEKRQAKETDRDKAKAGTKGITSWIMPADISAFNHKACFEKYGHIDWHSDNKFNQNDIVYIYYRTADHKICKKLGISEIIEKQILYKTIVEKTGLTSNDGDEFWYGKNPNYGGMCNRLKLISECKKDDLPYSYLKDNYGFNAPQGKASKTFPEGLIEYIDSFFTDTVELSNAGSNTEYKDKTDAKYDRDSETETTKQLNSDKSSYSYDSVSSGIDGENKIFYGTPGCGKSYYVTHTILKEFNKDYIFRTTFHQDYSNVDFVGQVMPVVKKSNSGSDVSYDFIPGPFTLALECAMEHPSEKVALVIEELNRGNAAAIFGDIFQLLDRVDTEDKVKSSGVPLGTSEYPIVNVGISNYFRNREKNPIELREIRIPANLFIYATMNTSDQNVFTLDTAFKRRWESEKLSNKFTDKDEIGKKYIPYSTGISNTTWRAFTETINNYMVNKGTFDSEDKQIGKYFVSANTLCDREETDAKKKAEAFAYKVLEYIWSDVAKFKRSDWFNEKIKCFDDLVTEYLSSGLSVFNSNIGFGNDVTKNSVESSEAETGEEENED